LLLHHLLDQDLILDLLQQLLHHHQHLQFLDLHYFLEKDLLEECFHFHL
jgi:hypothetical protein